MPQEEKFEILGFDLPTVALGVAGTALVVALFGLGNQWRADQQRTAEEASRKQRDYYNKYYQEYYRRQQEPEDVQAASAGPGPRGYVNDFDRIYVSEGTPNSASNTIKPEYMYGTPTNPEPLPDEMDPDMMRANAQMGRGAPSSGDQYFDPGYIDSGPDYDPTAPENLDWDEGTGELKARRRGNESAFGANVSAPN